MRSEAEQQVPPLRRRWRSGFGRDDRDLWGTFAEPFSKWSSVVGRRSSVVGNLFLVDAVNPHADQFVDAEVVNSARLHVADVFGRYVVNAHRNQVVRIGMRIS